MSHAHARSGAQTGPCVGESERTVLIVTSTGHRGHIDLVAIVLTGILQRETGFERVRVPDFGQAIRSGPDGPGGVGRVRSAGEPVEIGDIDCRDLPGNVLAAEQVRVVDAELRTVESRECRIDRDIDIVEA